MAPGDETLQVLEARVRAGLDALHRAHALAVRTVVAFPVATDVARLARGPDGALYFTEQRGSILTRVDPEDGSEAIVVHRGDKVAGRGGGRIGRIVDVERGGDGLVLLDDAAQAWHWRPDGETGRGRLAPVRFDDEDRWSVAHGDMATVPSFLGYRLYVVDPEQRNVLRFQPTFDGSAFDRSRYLVTDSDAVERMSQLHVDTHLYALTPDGVEKYESGRLKHLALAEPPDTPDLRPGSDYRLIAGTGSDASGGLLYLYDARWDRVVVFDKSSGAYVRQWLPGPEGPSMAGTRGLVVVPGAKKRPDTLYWLTPEGLFGAQLGIATVATEGASPGPADAKPRRGGRKRTGS